jgi:hypothetical protein
MHKAFAGTTAISPTIGESEIPGSEANQMHLKFVVNYREAAKRFMEWVQDRPQEY